MEHTYKNCHNLTCRLKERDFGCNQALEDFANALIDGEQNEEFIYNIEKIVERLRK